MDFENIIVDVKDGGVALITLNRPDALNALNDALINELGQAIDTFEADDSIRLHRYHGLRKSVRSRVPTSRKCRPNPIWMPSKSNFISTWERVAKCRKPVDRRCKWVLRWAVAANWR